MKTTGSTAARQQITQLESAKADYALQIPRLNAQGRPGCR